ncbi:hypothetical protein [Ekhidna sp. To15]|uniref:hypothetical protein n=1 Tax=Ekhidna sp. To15 TaxID=3395267 RepID=UPI003F525E26
MKASVLILFVVLSTSHLSFAQDKYFDKVQTLDSTIETLYAVISGEAGEKRDWELFKYLFTADAQLIPSGPNQDGEISYRVMSPEQYIETSGVWLEENGFFEKEINRVAESFGSLTHIFSSYESYRSESDEKPFTRGINSIQLMKDNERWWIVNIYWTGEGDNNPIPDKYLPKR